MSTNNNTANSSGDIASRIREVMDQESQASFARRCGVSEGAIRKYLLGASPSTENLIAMASAANVNIEWLATGRGVKQRSTTVNNGNVVVNGGSMAIGNGNTVHAASQSDVDIKQLTKALQIAGANPSHAKMVGAVYDLLQSGAPLTQIANLVKAMTGK